MPVLLIIDRAAGVVVNAAVPPKEGDVYPYDGEKFEVLLSDTGGIGWTYVDGVLTPPDMPEEESQPEE